MGIKFTVEADRNSKPMDDEVRVFLFHLMRDLLANIVKCAKPNKVSILINRTDANMRITIENDWAAESPMLSPDGPWVFSIRERLRYLGGSLEVEFAPGRKTRISLLVP